MANAAQNAPKLQIGNLSPEEAERLASTFRPIWELDDAPFAQGSALSQADVDALSAGAGVAASVRGTEQQQGGTYEIKSAPPPRVPGPEEPKVEIAAEAAPKPAPPPAPRVQAPPPKRVAEAAASGEFVPVKKSNTGIILIAVGAIALIGILVGVHSMMNSEPKGSSTTSTASTATAEATHTATTAIPPPPPETAAAGQPQPTEQQHSAPPPPEPTHEPVQAAPTHAAAQPTHAPTHHVAPPPPPPPHHATTHATGHTTHHAGGHATIVRDNPF